MLARSVVAAFAAASVSTTFQTQFATTSREFSRRPQTSRAAFRKLSILHQLGDDDSPALRECAEPPAPHASAFQDSNHRFARTYPIALAHLAESRETDTCLCNESRKAIVKWRQRCARTESVGNSCCPAHVDHACASRLRNHTFLRELDRQVDLRTRGDHFRLHQETRRYRIPVKESERQQRTRVHIRVAAQE